MFSDIPMEYKKTIPIIIFAICCAILLGQHFYVFARQASFEADRARYMSDILKITSEKSDTALTFDGDNDYINCGNDPSLNITDAITIEAWAKQDSQYFWHVIVSKDDSMGTAKYGIGMRYGEIGFTTSRITWLTGISFPSGFHHLAATYNGSQKRIYLDGELKNSTSATGSLGTGDDLLKIGQGYLQGEQEGYFNGIIDEVRIYDRALSESEIKDRYNGKEVETNDAETTTSNAETAGTDVVIEVASTTGFTVNDKIWIGDGTSEETATISAINSGVSITATIANNYDIGADIKRSDLVLRVSMNEGTGTAANDQSVYENNGTLEPTGSEPTWQDYSAPPSTFDAMPVLWISPQYSYISTAKYFDLSGNANHGTQTTEANKPTVKPPGLYFNGSSDYINCGSIGIGNEYTAESWIKTDRINCTSFNCGIIASSASAEEGYPLWLCVQGTEIYSFAYQSSSDGTLTSGANINTEDWFHIVQTAISGSTTKVYVNSVLKLTYNNVGTNPWTNILTIGDLRPNRALCFNGAIDEVRIYNRVLSVTQIQRLYLAGLPRHRQ